MFGAHFVGGRVSFGARFTHGTVSFRGAEFYAGSKVDFPDADFSGGTVTFLDARLSGGEVDFSGAADWTCPPEFPRTGTQAPAGVKLPEKQEQASD